MVRPDPSLIRSLRLRTGLTVVQLAVKAGVGERTVTRIERGQQVCTRERTLQALARVLDAPWEYLILKDEDEAEIASYEAV